jgi:hypothetical protein
MLRALCLLTCAVAVSVPSRAHAQSSERKGGPEKGTWGAEASVGGGFAPGVGEGGSLLRFVSPGTALVGGIAYSRTASEVRVTFEGLPDDLGRFPSVFNSAFTTVAVRAGVRRYTGTGLGLRPVVGGGLLFARSSVDELSDNSFGGYAEAGAAWFFNPHVSLGVLGGLSAVKQGGGWSTSGTLARLTGAVYF